LKWKGYPFDESRLAYYAETVTYCCKVLKTLALECLVKKLILAGKYEFSFICIINNKVAATGAATDIAGII
jgi:hypothetical protein